VQDLTHDPRTGGKAYLSPSSMNAGNTTADDPQLSMTAPGSVSILPVAERLDVLPLPQWSAGGQIPLSHPGMQERVQVQSSRGGSIPWTDAHDIPSGGPWKETS
jgi:hypothetical protein